MEIEGCQRVDKKFSDGTLWCLVTISYRLLLVTSSKPCENWNWRAADWYGDEKGLGRTGAGESGLMFRYYCTMEKCGGKHCPIEYSQFCSSRLARTSNDLFHDFSSMNELINKCFRRKPFSYRIVSWPIIISIDIHSMIEISIFWGVLSKGLLPIFKEECISNIVASTLSADSAGQT